MLKSVLRQLTSLILPFTALILVPLWLVLRPLGRSTGDGRLWLPRPEPPLHLAGGPALVAGIALMAAGLSIMAVTIAAFIRVGRGTLAPWSPTRRLVITGLYAHVRNPMILGVLTVLLGEALAFGSWRIAAWAAAFFAINTAYFIFLEEPGLERRFGEEYCEYRRNVPRWVPRLKAWKRSSP